MCCTATGSSLFGRCRSAAPIPPAEEILCYLHQAPKGPEHSGQRLVLEATARDQHNDQETDREGVFRSVAHRKGVGKGRKGSEVAPSPHNKQTGKVQDVSGGVGVALATPLPEPEVSGDAPTKDTAVVVVVGTTPLAGSAVVIIDLPSFSPHEAPGAIGSVVYDAYVVFGRSRCRPNVVVQTRRAGAVLPTQHPGFYVQGNRIAGFW
mmetsp:Transcript_25786/g.56746  ORF Transcript_25786/g.56746 Transcript_25786/m.56746 type:complete len:207 (+) Transcript_25786:220-840(+)